MNQENPQHGQPDPQHHGEGHDPLPQGKAISTSRAISIAVVLFIAAVIVAIVGIIPRIRAKAALEQATPELAAPTVVLVHPLAGQPANEVVLPASLSAYTDAPIFARTNGYLHKWYFDIGAHVAKGALLADISTPEVDQQLMQARADLATAEANSKQAKATSARYQDLLKADAVTQQDTENFTSQAAALDAAVKSSQANVRRLEELQSFQKIYAPFDGVITARNIDVGQLVDSGAAKELFHLAAIRTLRVYVNVPQTYANGIHVGMTPLLTFAELPGRKFTGKLVRTANAIDPNSRTLLVEIDVDNSRGELLPGAYAEVHFDIKAQGPSVIIPVSALMFRAEGLRVAVVEGDKARLITIVLGQDDGRTVQVISGLDANSRIIQNPPDSLIDGEIVRVVTPDQQPAPQGAQQK